MVLFDEAHKMAAVRRVNKDMANATGKKKTKWAHGLDAKECPAAKRLFLTATPKLLGSRASKAKEEDLKEIVSMDNEAQFGKRVYTLNLRQAIDDWSHL